MTKKSRKNINILRTKRAFEVKYKAFFIIFKELLVAKNCLRPESAPFNDVFLRKAMTGVALNTFPNVLLIFNICQCLLMISLIFGKIGLYVTENGITFFRTALVLFNRVDFSRLSTFSIWFRIIFFSLYPFSTNRLSNSFESFLYLSKVEETCFILNAWL